jgi:serine protease Do
MKDTDVGSGDEEDDEKSETALGLTVTNIDQQTARQLNLESDEGVVITKVKLNSPADEAGLQRGDVVLEINRKPVSDVGDYRELTSNLKKGDTLLFLIYRQGRSVFVPVEIN